MYTLSNPFRQYALSAARCADEKHALDVVLLDLRNASYGLSDYLLLMTANSTVHLGALRDSIKDNLETLGLYLRHQDGRRGAHWVVLDYGGVIVHIFSSDSRSNYSLERLWEDAKPVAWSTKPIKKVRSAAKKKKK